MSSARSTGQRSSSHTTRRWRRSSTPSSNNFSRGRFRVRADLVEVYPATADEEAVRIEFFGDEIDAITRFDPLTGHAREALNLITFFPAKQFVTPADKLNRALTTIRAELMT